jgi:hypothetical protein
MVSVHCARGSPASSTSSRWRAPTGRTPAVDALAKKDSAFPTSHGHAALRRRVSGAVMREYQTGWSDRLARRLSRVSVGEAAARDACKEQVE